MTDPTLTVEPWESYPMPAEEKAAIRLYIDRMVAQAADAEQAQVLNDAYWKLRKHASGYRSANVFRRAMEAYEADRADPVKCRRAMNHEWYARGIEAAARTVADLIGVPEHEIAERLWYASYLPCCDLHGAKCEPPSELCCHDCTEAGHDSFPIRHADGSRCVLDTTKETR